MTAFLRALADRRGLAPEPDLRWPYQLPAVVDSFTVGSASLRDRALELLPWAVFKREDRRSACE